MQAFASGTFSPAPPQLIVLQAMKVARGPVVRHQQSVYAMKKSEQKRIVEELAKQANADKLQQFTPKAPNRKRKVNSQIDRNLRKSERMQRVNSLVRKFQASAQIVADQQQEEQRLPPLGKSDGPRGAVVEYERFHIPKYVPKLDSFEEVSSSNTVKPSQMLSSRNFDKTPSDSDDSDSDTSMSSEEDARQMLGEVAEAELQHINRTSITGAVLPPKEETSSRPEYLSIPEKYSMMERLVNKEVSDQVITQLTLRMGGDAINVVVYWLAREESLRINAFCFAG